MSSKNTRKTGVCRNSIFNLTNPDFLCILGHRYNSKRWNEILKQRMNAASQRLARFSLSQRQSP
jgi:hypothetical protein